MNRFMLRLGVWMEEVVKYSRYVANGGLLFTLYFTLIYGAFVYNDFLNRVDSSFPGEWVTAIVLLLMPLGHRPRTFLQEADQVFLLPELGEIRSYLNGVRLFNIGFAVMRAFFVLLVLLPLLVRTEGYSGIEVMAVIGLVVLIAIAGRLAKLEGAGYIVLPFAFVSGGLVIFGFPVWAVGPAVIPFVLLHVKRNERIPLLDWLKLEEDSKAQFDRVLSWFVELPALKEDVKERKVMTRILEKNVLKRADAARYVYGLRILRANDSLDLVFRLTAVALVIMWLSGGWYVGFVPPLFVGLTALQLVPLFKRLDAVSIVSWLPVTREERLKGYSWWANRILITQAVLLAGGSLIFGATWDAAVGVIFSIGVIRYYLNRLT